MSQADFKFHTSVRVRWMEGDAQGIAFNGAYMGYLEIAQAEYFRNLGFSIYKVAERGYFDSAVVKAATENLPPRRPSPPVAGGGGRSVRRRSCFRRTTLRTSPLLGGAR